MASTSYLLSFNAIQAALWSTVLVQAGTSLTAAVGVEQFFHEHFFFLRWTQMLSLLDVLHSWLRISKSGPLVTALQTGSRLAIVFLWGHCEAAHQTPAFYGCVLAWSLAEVIRSVYYIVSLVAGEPEWIPRVLVWIRYSGFIVLYPVGVASELLCVRKVLLTSSTLRWAYWCLLLVYLPGFPYLYGHMLSLRSRKLKHD
ncbi:MAG: uncharacterized protein KVP18_000068 [Porospora cf. gigantea A]|uniref:uncharacterized protein n=1 Tax=Porospora cf. gigantea A TaxID=2853593 RepID=UPI00355A1DE9|nr:MAG: hypothetical protein KVP18_000068 [Porospora cf. gigantea A]